MNELNGTRSAPAVRRSIRSIIAPADEDPIPDNASVMVMSGGISEPAAVISRMTIPSGTINEARAMTGILITTASAGKQLKKYIVSGSIKNCMTTIGTNSFIILPRINPEKPAP